MPTANTNKVKKADQPEAKDFQVKQAKKTSSKSKTNVNSTPATKPKGPAPQTMEELFAQTNYQLQVPRKNDVVTGLVSDITRKMVVVDIGGKTEGIVVDKEFELAKEFVDELSPGDEIAVCVISEENDRGQTLLSLRKAAVDKKWEAFEAALKSGETVEVKGIETNRGGMIVVAFGVRGFVPSSQFSKQYLGQLARLLGQKFEVKVIEVDREKNRLIFSERHVSEAEMIAQREVALDVVKVNDDFEGLVCGIMPFGLFVSVEVPLPDGKKGQLEGLVHISEMSWRKVDDPKSLYKVGDKVKVRVLGVDQNTGKLNLSIKQLSDDPWARVNENYTVGSTVKGKVSRVVPFGVFVNFEPGVDGLIHVSKLMSGREFMEDEDVSVTVESVEPEKRRMSLSPLLTEVPVGYK